MYVLLVPALHFIRLFYETTDEYVLSYYIATHFIVLFYLAFFSAGVFFLQKSLPECQTIIESAKSMSDGWLKGAFYAWIIIKTYLFFKYGAGAFSDFKIYSPVGSELVYSLWETPIITFVSIFSVGASVIFIIKAASINGYGKNITILIPFILYLIVNTISHDIAIGPRRFILLLFIVYFFSICWKGWTSLEKNFLISWKKFIVLAIVVLGLTGYYQLIRNNIFRPEIVELISSPNPMDFTRGLLKALVIAPEDQRIETTASFFREGPYEILYQVIKKLETGNPGTRGEISYNSILMVMPRMIVGDTKTDLNADDFFASKMGITPLSLSNRPDIATSMPAIFIADFGIIGIFMAPIIMLFIVIIFNSSLSNRKKINPLLILFLFSMLVTIAGSVEGDIVAVLANLRNYLLLWFICIPISFLFPTKQNSILIKTRL